MKEQKRGPRSFNYSHVTENQPLKGDSFKLLPLFQALGCPSMSGNSCLACARDSSALFLKALVPCSKDEAGRVTSQAAAEPGGRGWPESVGAPSRPTPGPPLSTLDPKSPSTSQIQGQPLPAETTSQLEPAGRNSASQPLRTGEKARPSQLLQTTCLHGLPRCWHYSHTPAGNSRFQGPALTGLSWEDSSQLFCLLVLFLPATTFQSSRNSSERSGLLVAPFTLQFY